MTADGISPGGRTRLVAGLLATTLATWGLALAGVRHRELTDLGLVSVLPAWAYLALVPLAGAMAIVLHRPRVPLVSAIAVTLVAIAVLYGTSPLLSGEPRLAAAWRHLGVVDYIVRNGRVDPAVDVYHNWPGYFALVATLAQASGVLDLRDVALWAPVWQNVLYLPALHLLLGSLIPDRRVVWLATWVFYSANWIGQDYLSPQAMGFFFYLVLVSLVVRWLASRDARADAAGNGPPACGLAGSFARIPGRPARWLLDRLYAVRPPAADDLPGRARAVLLGAILLVSGYVVTAHQLTPFFMLAAITALIVLLRFRWLALLPLMVVAVAGWALFAAVPYLAGHLDQIAARSGGMDGFEANLTARLVGSPDHRLVVAARLAVTAAVWALAGLGVLRRLRAGHWDVTTVALAAAPFPLFALQSYGGEMLLRITLFAMPPVALLVALAFLPRRGTVSTARTAGVFGLALALTGTLLLTRYGNERLETFTPDEVAAVRALYAVAAPGSLMIGVSGNMPWKFTRYEHYAYRPSGDANYVGRRDELLEAAADHGGPVYLIVTRGQRAAVELLGGEVPGVFDTFVDAVLTGGPFRVVYQNPDALIARYTGPSTSP